MAMTRRDYTWLANMIRTVKDKDLRLSMAIATEQHCRANDYNFDVKRFNKAAGVEELLATFEPDGRNPGTGRDVMFVKDESRRPKGA